MALWWIKGRQRETDEAIEFLLEADSEDAARQKAERSGIEVASATAYQGSTELSAIRLELTKIYNELATLRRTVAEDRSRILRLPTRTIVVGVFFGALSAILLAFGVLIVLWLGNVGVVRS